MFGFRNLIVVSAVLLLGAPVAAPSPVHAATVAEKLDVPVPIPTVAGDDSLGRTLPVLPGLGADRLAGNISPALEMHRRVPAPLITTADPECSAVSDLDPAVGTNSSKPALPGGECPDGVWGHDHGYDGDYGDGAGVTWCEYTASYEVTISGGFSVIVVTGGVSVTFTLCVYSGCGLELTEEAANTGGRH